MEACSRFIRNTVSELEDIFSEKICKIFPVFTFYPDSLNFNQNSIPLKMKCATAGFLN